MGCGASSAQAKYEHNHEEEAVRAELRASGWLPPEGQAPWTNPSGPEIEKVSVKAPEPEVIKEEVQPKDASSGIAEVENAEPALPERPSAPSVLDSNAVYERAIRFLNKVPLLKLIPRGDLPLIVKAMDTHEFVAGQTVIQQGEMTDRLFIILSGSVEVARQKTHSDGSTEAEKVIAKLSSGDYFGERELLLAEKARATVRTVGDEKLLLYSIAHEPFFHLGLHERLHLPKRRALVGWREAQDARQSSAALQDPKSDAEHSFLLAALKANTYLPSACEITDEVLEQLVTAAVRCTASSGDVLFRQGDRNVGRFCIIESGSFDMAAEGCADAIADMAGSIGLAMGTERMGEAGSWHARRTSGSTFGEMELFLSLPARATVTAAEESVYWAVGRTEFTEILSQQLEARLTGYMKALRGVRCFAGLYNEELYALAKGVTEVSYTVSEDVVTQGEISDACYVLVQGEAVQKRDGVETGKRYAACSEEKVANFFGEKELLHEGQRGASVVIVSETAQVLCIDRETFELILAPLEEVLKKDDEDTQEKRRCTSDISEDAPPMSRAATTKNTDEQVKTIVIRQPTLNCQKISDSKTDAPVKREDLELIGNLGSGQFGVVDLAEEKGTGRRFAFKSLHRKHFSEPWHAAAVKREKAILQMTSSPFLVSLYATYKEPQSLTFLMELVTGGDLRMALYRDDIRGRDDCAHFYCAGVILAVEHLHERHIVHRDLKPDNILLDEKGWPKVTDFGLAKFCVGKTFTVTGSPNYMAPESWQPAGHDLAVDWWALGCVTYELMAGRTPFESATGNFHQLFRRINRGIHKLWPWPSNFHPLLQKFLSCLVHKNSSMRLPMRHGGVAKLQAHVWFEGFNWPAYKDKLLQPPVVPPSLGSLQPCQSLQPLSPEDAAIAEAVDWDSAI